jgi:hypothetical protein
VTGVLLGDADVEEAVGERLGEPVEAGAGGHRGRDRDDPVVGQGLLTSASANTPV